MEYSPLAPEQFNPIKKTGNATFDVGKFMFWVIIALLFIIIVRAVIVTSKTNLNQSLENDEET